MAALPLIVQLHRGQATGVDIGGNVTSYTLDALPEVAFTVPADLENDLGDLGDLIPYLEGRLFEAVVTIEALKVTKQGEISTLQSEINDINVILNKVAEIRAGHLTASGHVVA